jgi:hypothetical protein
MPLPGPLFLADTLVGLGQSCQCSQKIGVALRQEGPRSFAMPRVTAVVYSQICKHRQTIVSNLRPN